MIAVTFALPEESRDFLRTLRRRSVQAHGRERIWRGELEGHQVLVTHTGVGSAGAGAAVRRLLAEHRPELLICAGYGGGLDPRLRVGDVVIDLRGEQRALSPDAWEGLRTAPFFGAIATHAQAIETIAEKAAFARETGALAVDMETAVVAAAAAEQGVPVVGIRAISDTADQDLPVPMEHWFDLVKQRPRQAALLRFLARHPRRIVPFIRFANGLPKARGALTRAMTCAILGRTPKSPSLLAASVPLALLSAVVVAFYLVVDWRGRSAWEAYETDARSRGVKLTLAEHLSPEIPDRENFASIPIFRDVLAAAADGAEPREYFRLPGRPANVSSSIDWVRLIDLGEWKKFLVGRNELRADGAIAPADALLSYLQSYEPYMAQLREAARRPSVRFPAEWDKNLNPISPHTHTLLQASGVNLLRMEAHLAKGEIAAAHADFRLGLRLAQAGEREPGDFNAMIYSAQIEILAQGIWSGLATDRWDADTLQQIQADLSNAHPLKNYALALNKDRARMNDLYAKLRSRRPELSELFAGTGADNKGAKTITDYIRHLMPTGWLYDNQLATNRFTDEVLREVDAASGRYFPDPAIWESRKLREGSPFRILHYLIFHVTAPNEGSAAKAALSQTRAQQAQVACALERFRLTNGAYPETLEALVPTFLSAVPGDVMDGHPMRYRTDSDRRFVLYSIGLNQQDDGGSADRTKRAKKQLDWVWTYPPAVPATATP